MATVLKSALRKFLGHLLASESGSIAVEYGILIGIEAVAVVSFAPWVGSKWG
jgi:Flp pilus assembly pilin Flp